MAEQPTPSAVDRMNLTLGALAAALAVAILGVLFVGTGEPPASGATPITTESATPSVTSTTVPAESVSPMTTSTADAFVMPPSLTGTWRSADGATVAQFGPGIIEGLQSNVDVDLESVSLLLVEPSALAGTPTETQPVQAVLYLSTVSETTLSRPEPVLVEFLATVEGLRLSFQVGGTMVEVHLRPGL